MTYLIVKLRSVGTSILQLSIGYKSDKLTINYWITTFTHLHLYTSTEKVARFSTHTRGKTASQHFQHFDSCSIRNVRKFELKIHRQLDKLLVLKVTVIFNIDLMNLILMMVISWSLNQPPCQVWRLLIQVFFSKFNQTSLLMDKQTYRHVQ